MTAHSEGPGIGPPLEWRREQRGEVIAERPPAPPAPRVNRGTVAAWLVFMRTAVPHPPPASTEGGQGRALAGRRDWRDPDHDVPDIGQQLWHNAYSPPPWRRHDDMDTRLRQLEAQQRGNGWPA
jgi:hypothetical protein